MAAVATKELIRGTASNSLLYGPSDYTEIITVKGCTGASFAAIEADAKSAAGVDTLGTAHTDPLKTSYRLWKVRTELITPTDVKIYATYKGDAATRLLFEVFGALNGKTDNYDYAGNAMELTKPVSLTDATQPDYYIIDANVLKPQTVIRMTKTGLSGITFTTAVDQSKAYTGFVNDDTFLGCAAGELLCTKYALSDDSGGGAFSWNRVVEVQYDPVGWQLTKSYRLINGIVYHDQDANSEKTFNIYGTANFPTTWHTI